MPIQSNKNSYKGQNIFVGIDAHARQWHVFASPYPGIGAKAVCMSPSAAIIEASWTAVSKDPTLGAFFSKCRREGKHPNVAIIAVARKLVNRIFYVWRTKSKYDLSKE